MPFVNAKYKQQLLTTWILTNIFLTNFADYSHRSRHSKLEIFREIQPSLDKYDEPFIYENAKNAIKSLFGFNKSSSLWEDSFFAIADAGGASFEKLGRCGIVDCQQTRKSTKAITKL